MTLYDKVIWLAIAALGIALLVAYRATGLEFPPEPKVYKPAKGVTQGSGAAALLEPVAPKGGAIPPAPITNLWVGWNWTPTDGHPQSNVVFLVRMGTGYDILPSYGWPVIVKTADKKASVPVDRTIKAAWFTVTASNIVTHEESSFATK
jgi:hypothetical protein